MTGGAARSRKVSMLSGLFCVLVFLLVLFCFCALPAADTFAEAERIRIPNFIGAVYTDVAEHEGLRRAVQF
jgi:riboflavin transporter FmnP